MLKKILKGLIFFNGGSLIFQEDVLYTVSVHVPLRPQGAQLEEYSLILCSVSGL